MSVTRVIYQSVYHGQAHTLKLNNFFVFDIRPVRRVYSSTFYLMYNEMFTVTSEIDRAFRFTYKKQNYFSYAKFSIFVS